MSSATKPLKVSVSGATVTSVATKPIVVETNPDKPSNGVGAKGDSPVVVLLPVEDVNPLDDDGPTSGETRGHTSTRCSLFVVLANARTVNSPQFKSSTRILRQYGVKDHEIRKELRRFLLLIKSHLKLDDTDQVNDKHIMLLLLYARQNGLLSDPKALITKHKDIILCASSFDSKLLLTVNDSGRVTYATCIDGVYVTTNEVGDYARDNYSSIDKVRNTQDYHKQFTKEPIAIHHSLVLYPTTNMSSSDVRAWVNAHREDLSLPSSFVVYSHPENGITNQPHWRVDSVCGRYGDASSYSKLTCGDVVINVHHAQMNLLAWVPALVHSLLCGKNKSTFSQSQFRQVGPLDETFGVIRRFPNGDKVSGRVMVGVLEFGLFAQMYGRLPRCMKIERGANYSEITNSIIHYGIRSIFLCDLLVGGRPSTFPLQMLRGCRAVGAVPIMASVFLRNYVRTPGFTLSSPVKTIVIIGGVSELRDVEVNLALHPEPAHIVWAVEHEPREDPTAYDYAVNGLSKTIKAYNVTPVDFPFAPVTSDTTLYYDSAPVAADLVLIGGSPGIEGGQRHICIRAVGAGARNVVFTCPNVEIDRMTAVVPYCPPSSDSVLIMRDELDSRITVPLTAASHRQASFALRRMMQYDMSVVPGRLSVVEVWTLSSLDELVLKENDIAMLDGEAYVYQRFDIRNAQKNNYHVLMSPDVTHMVDVPIIITDIIQDKEYKTTTQVRIVDDPSSLRDANEIAEFVQCEWVNESGAWTIELDFESFIF
jgi:hypothetical protein